MDTSLLIEGGIGIAATAAIVQSVKMAGMRSRYAPILSLVIGMTLSVVYSFITNTDPVETLILGFLFGGVASHGYDVVTKTNKRY